MTDMKINHAASFAEQIVSPHFADVTNKAWREHGDQYIEYRSLAEDVIATSISQRPENTNVAWEAERRAAIVALDDSSFAGSPYYHEYFVALPGAAAHTDETKTADQNLGERGPVKTNSALIALNKEVADPVKFFGSALQTIDLRRTQQANAIGPENYATSLKFFTDKILDTSMTISEEQLDQVSTFMNQWHHGFKDIAAKDTPNFVELTNIASAIRRLPREVLPSGFAKTFVRYALEGLPQFSRGTAMSSLNALGRIDSSEVPFEQAVLTNLTIKMLGQFERSSEFTTALRAIANLTPSKPTHDAVQTVLTYAYGLEQPVTDLQSLSEISNLLRTVAIKSIDDPALTLEVKDRAQRCATRAIQLFKLRSEDPTISQEELANDRQIANMIVINYDKI
ncbi:MAG TPA: hypothetical protein VFN56_01705 [Candidatus Saccharimonadales bacterium]|nr:hypothetical protein [Candidatus Saccharimonadales bacterium]